jgi:hypothetical protein
MWSATAWAVGRSVSSFATSEEAFAALSEVIVSLSLSYRLPGFHHIRHKGASVHDGSGYAPMVQREVTGFSTR